MSDFVLTQRGSFLEIRPQSSRAQSAQDELFLGLTTHPGPAYLALPCQAGRALERLRLAGYSVETRP